MTPWTSEPPEEAGCERAFCVGEREVARIYNVSIYERRGMNDEHLVFALRAGQHRGPRLDPFVAQQAIAGNADCLCLLAQRIEQFYAARPQPIPEPEE